MANLDRIGTLMVTAIGALITIFVLALVYSNLLPVVYPTIFNSTDPNSLITVFGDIWEMTLTPLVGASTAQTLGDYIAVAIIMVLAIVFTFGLVSWLRDQFNI